MVNQITDQTSDQTDDQMTDEIVRNQWHPAYVAAIELEFDDNINDFYFDDEHKLSKTSLAMDLMVVKMNEEAEITSEIGENLLKYNVFEFKSPDDGLNLDVLSKAVAYALLYKALGNSVNEIPYEELTVNLLRFRKPEKMFESLIEAGATINMRHPGIYDITNIPQIPIQVIVTRELDPVLHPALRALSTELLIEEARALLELVRSIIERGDKGQALNADAILQIALSLNMPVFEQLMKEDPIVCEALRVLMKEEIEKELAKAEAEARADAEAKLADVEAKLADAEAKQAEAEDSKIEAVRDSVLGVMAKLGVDRDEAMDVCRVSQDIRKRVMALL